MDESEFKKLSANNRDWLIYQLLSERSKKTVEKEIKSETIVISDEELEQRKASIITVKPTGDTTVEETVKGKIALVTDKAVLIGNADRVAWFPKSVIENLDKIALKQGEIVELKVKEWFKYKIEWKVAEQ